MAVLGRCYRLRRNLAVPINGHEHRHEHRHAVRDCNCCVGVELRAGSAACCCRCQRRVSIVYAYVISIAASTADPKSVRVPESLQYKITMMRGPKISTLSIG